MDSLNRSVIINEFYSNFPFLETNRQLLNSSINFIHSAYGNYSGEVKTTVLENEKSDGASKNKRSYRYLVNFENNTSLTDVQLIRHGWGKMSWKNGTLYGSNLQFIYGEQDEYIGQWLDNIQHGLGILRTKTGTYVGDWFEGLQQGNGTALYKNGNKYEGEFWKGLKHGRGIFEVPSKGDMYTGEFKNGMRHGKGAEYFGETSERYVGEYKEDMRHGTGSAYYPDGSLKYTGAWKYSNPNGIGTAYYSMYNQDPNINDKFVIQSLHGIFRNGVFVGPAPPKDKTTRKVFTGDPFSSPEILIDNMFSYFRNSIFSFYEKAAFTVKIIVENIPGLIKILG